ncbi:hypothetical protein DWX34_11490 [Ruminococcus sp. AF19-15]|jgi:hypothetical protein|nr:hypothetical protein DWX34_11490 [Ruminococcus sp. AF19-15]DAZ61230.1 MAG TPA: hypothetical protein [Caudoviricetes sp.]
MTITLNADYDVTLNTALLGYVGETNARPVSVEGLTVDGADRYVLTIDYGDGVTYEVDITGGQWTPTADILRSAQTVSCQICAKKLSGDEYILVKKSRIFRLRIGAAIGDTAIPSPDVSMDALDRIDAIGRQAHADMQTAVTAAETATTAANNATKSATNAGVSADTAEQAASRAETAKTAAETSATQADTAMQGAETARQQAVAAQNNAKISAAQASVSAQQVEADKTITAGYAKTAKTCADSTAVDRQAVTDMATQVTADKANVTENAAKVAEDRTAAETAAQTAQAVADSLPEDYTTAVGKIAENTAEISAVKLSDKELQRRVDALYDIGQGITHKFETDTDTAYAKTIPTGAKLMSVKSVGGRSIVFNQMYKKFDYVSGGTLNCKPIFKSHKYLLRVDYSVSENTKVYLYFRAAKYTAETNRQIVKDVAAGSGKISWITSPLGEHSDGGDFGVFRLVTDSDGNQKLDTSPFSNYEIFDLTQMFGIGNEPTSVEEFEAMFPNNYYQYNAGEIITADTESVVVQGKNLINADDYYAPYKQSDGSYVNDSVGFANINIPIGNFIGKTLVATLKATVSAQPTSFFWAARINGLKVESSYEKGERVLANTTGIARLTFTPKTQKDTLSMTYGQGTGDVIVRDIQIELGDTPTTYAPFHRNVYQIPEVIKALPGYGVEGNVTDYEAKTYTQNNTIDGTAIKALDTPIITDISSLIPDDFLRNIEVEAGGSVTFKGGNDSYRIPVPSEEEYIVKLSEIGGTT